MRNSWYLSRAICAPPLLACILLIGIFFAALKDAICQRAPRIEPGDLESLALDSTVLVRGELDGAGFEASGIIVGIKADRLFIVTACHSVHQRANNAADLKVIFWSLPNDSFPAQVVKFDSSQDIAIVEIDRIGSQRIPEATMEAIPYDTKYLQPGQRLYSIGLLNRWQEREETFAHTIGSWIYQHTTGQNPQL